jgi:hypothetical protein
MRFINPLHGKVRIAMCLSILVVICMLCGMSVYAQQSFVASSDAKPESFLAGNPDLLRTLAFVNSALVSKLRYIGQHNPAGKVLMGKSVLHLNDQNRHRTLVQIETPVMEDMANASDSPRNHLSVATALKDDLNVEAASFNGEYVVVPCKTGKKCVENRLLLADSHDQKPASLPGLGTLMTSVWAPPSQLVIGPFPDGQAQSMVPVVQHLLK